MLCEQPSQPSGFHLNRQWLGGDVFSHAAGSPEQALLVAMLMDAIRCLGPTVVAPSGRGRQCTREEAQHWIFGDYDNSPFFSFDQVCTYLGFEPGLIRGLIRKSTGLGRSS